MKPLIITTDPKPEPVEPVQPAAPTIKADGVFHSQQFYQVQPGPGLGTSRLAEETYHSPMPPEAQTRAVFSDRALEICRIAASGTPKTSQRFIIVKTDGSCLELQEAPGLTPKEIMGFCKFFSLVSLSATPCNQSIKWSKMIANLGLNRHFVLTVDDFRRYKNNTEVLNVFLFDSP